MTNIMQDAWKYYNIEIIASRNYRGFFIVFT